MKIKIISFLLLSLWIVFVPLKAQYMDDVLRYSANNGYYTVRAGALGTAFNGISDDVASLEFNPAGMALLGKSEFSIGVGINSNSTSTNFLDGTNQSSSSTDGYLNNIGIIAPFRIGKYGNLNASFGIGYFMEGDLDNHIRYRGMNNNSSFVGYITQNGSQNAPDNMAYNLWLAGNNPFSTPIKGGNLQQGTISESGGMHSITGGFAFEFSKFFTAGFTLAGKWAHYTYHNDYTETDVNNIYNSNTQYIHFDTTNGNPDNNPDSEKVDLKSFNYSNDLEQSLSGISGSLGCMVKFGDHFRFGMAIKFPTYYSVDETYSETATATFDAPRSYFNNTSSPNPWAPEASSKTYGIVTPFVYSLGLSYNLLNLTLSAGVEYSDATQAQFVDAPPELGLDQVNQDILNNLTSQFSWGIGAEYEVPRIPLVLRASYSSKNSPYLNDITGSTVTNYAFGIGYYAAPNIRLEALVRFTHYKMLMQVYGNNQSYNPQTVADQAIPIRLVSTANESYYYQTDSPVSIGIGMTVRY